MNNDVNMSYIIIIVNKMRRLLKVSLYCSDVCAHNCKHYVLYNDNSLEFVDALTIVKILINQKDKIPIHFKKFIKTKTFLNKFFQSSDKLYISDNIVYSKETDTDINLTYDNLCFLIDQII